MNLNYSGDKKFQNLLDDAGIPWSIYEVKAYILGSILAPELVPPSHLFRTVLAQDTDEEVEFENKEEGQRFLTDFMGLWNEMAGFQGKKKAPIFSPIPEQYEESDDLLEALSSRAGELESLLFGLTQGGFEPAGLSEGDAKDFVGVLVAGKMMLDEAMEKIEKDPTEQTCAQGDTLLRLIDKKWTEGFSVLESELRKLRGRALDALQRQAGAEEFHEPTPKVGRNDPCPCGSGKKYKKCCLQ